MDVLVQFWAMLAGVGDWISCRKDELGVVLQSLTFIALLGSVYFIYRQLKTSNKQAGLNRIVAAKSSIQEVNKLIFQHDDDIIPFLYGGFIDKKDKDGEDARAMGMRTGKKYTIAFTLLNALEILYHMRLAERDKKNGVRDEVRQLIKIYIRGSVKTIEELWKETAYRAAFHQDFQDEVAEVVKTLQDEENESKASNHPPAP